MLMLLATLTANGATLADAPPPSEMAQTSAAVVRGIVEETDSSWEDGLVVTTYIVAVEETLRGKAASKVTVRLPGGHWGGLTQTASGIPVWDVGADVILFLPKSGPMPLTGLLTVDGDQVRDQARFDKLRPLDEVVAEIRTPATTQLGARAEHQH